MICFYLGWSGSILQFKQSIIKVGSKSWLLTCSSNITLSLPSYTSSALRRELNFCNGYLSLLYFWLNWLADTNIYLIEDRFSLSKNQAVIYTWSLHISWFDILIIDLLHFYDEVAQKIKQKKTTHPTIFFPATCNYSRDYAIFPSNFCEIISIVKSMLESKCIDRVPCLEYHAQLFGNIFLFILFIVFFLNKQNEMTVEAQS